FRSVRAAGSGEGEVDGGDDVLGGQRLVALVEGLPCLFHGFGRSAQVPSEDLGLDAAGRDLGDTDPFADGVVADLPGDLVHRRLRRVVGGVAVEVVQPGDAGDVHDVPAIAVDHAGQEHTDQLQHGAYVDVHHVVQVLAGRAQDVPLPADPGVVDEDVDVQGADLCFHRRSVRSEERRVGKGCRLRGGEGGNGEQDA